MPLLHLCAASLVNLSAGDQRTKEILLEGGIHTACVALLKTKVDHSSCFCGGFRCRRRCCCLSLSAAAFVAVAAAASASLLPVAAFVAAAAPSCCFVSLLFPPVLVLLRLRRLLGSCRCCSSSSSCYSELTNCSVPCLMLDCSGRKRHASGSDAHPELNKVGGSQAKVLGSWRPLPHRRSPHGERQTSDL